MFCEIPVLTGPFKDAIIGYVDFKRSLGYDYGKSIVYRLREIDSFFKDMGVMDIRITEEMHDAWATCRAGESATNRRKRVQILIAFEMYLAERGHSGIFVGELPRKGPPRSFVPYIYTRTEIALLFEVAREREAIAPSDRDNATFVALLSLYYGCGLRKSEAQGLLVRDVNFDTGRIQILDSKNHVSRIVVAADSVRMRLVRYRDRFCLTLGMDDLLFQFGAGRVFPNWKLYRLYHEAQASAGIRPLENGHLPRIHDLRHTFCVHALETMTEKGFDLYASAPLLVKYLGHRCISETERYLRLAGENFASVTDKSRVSAPAIFPKVGDADGE